jgi:hypothetical protein
MKGKKRLVSTKRKAIVTSDAPLLLPRKLPTYGCWSFRTQDMTKNTQKLHQHEDITNRDIRNGLDNR